MTKFMMMLIAMLLMTPQFAKADWRETYIHGPIRNVVNPKKTIGGQPDYMGNAIRHYLKARGFNDVEIKHTSLVNIPPNDFDATVTLISTAEKSKGKEFAKRLLLKSTGSGGFYATEFPETAPPANSTAQATTAR